MNQAQVVVVWSDVNIKDNNGQHPSLDKGLMIAWFIAKRVAINVDMP